MLFVVCRAETERETSGDLSEKPVGAYPNASVWTCMSTSVSELSSPKISAAKMSGRTTIAPRRSWELAGEATSTFLVLRSFAFTRVIVCTAPLVATFTPGSPATLSHTACDITFLRSSARDFMKTRPCAGSRAGGSMGFFFFPKAASAEPEFPIVPMADAAHAESMEPDAPAIMVFMSAAVLEMPDLETAPAEVSDETALDAENVSHAYPLVRTPLETPLVIMLMSFAFWFTASSADCPERDPASDPASRFTLSGRKVPSALSILALAFARKAIALLRSERRRVAAGVTVTAS
mmetsp:Transcript_39388/g.93253  ORF Transcript_39388/g.93253 Transcript_39388/m.93253 type:complete len:293 (+) Transcript_39388:2408-3286(+)